MKLIITVLSFFCMVALPADPKYLDIAEIKPVTLIPGQTDLATISVKVTPPFHVQSNPAAMRTLIPTTLTVQGVSSLTVQKPIYPPGKPYRLQGAGMQITAYEGTFDIKVPITASREAKAGKRNLKGTLKFQACNDTICFFPSSLPVTVPVTVSPQ